MRYFPKMKYLLLTVLLCVTANIWGAEKMSDVEKIFENSLTQRGVSFERIGDKLYKVKNADLTQTVSLQNIEKNYARDGDAGAIQRFIGNILQPVAKLPDAARLRQGLFITVEPSDYIGLEKFLHKELSDTTVGILAYYSKDQNQIRWISESDLGNRHIKVNEAWDQAASNLEKIMSVTKVSFSNAGGQKLGMIEAYEPYKASLILTKGLKDKVAGQIGWPIYAVAPARDFVLLFSKESGLIRRVGGVVVDEYKKSGYPISTEVWELSDDAQKAVGEFPIK